MFYPDIFLYFPACLCLMGIPLVVSYNIFLIVINFATIIIAYYSYTKISESAIIGTLAAILYTLSTYRLVDLYTRGAMGEYLALIFCPLALCGLVLMKRGVHGKWWILALAYSGLLQSHMLSFVMMAVVAVVFSTINLKDFFNIKVITSIIKAVLAIILLNAWFLVPLLQAVNMNVIAFLGTNSFWQTDASLIQLFDIQLLSVGGHEVYTGGIAESMPKTPGVLLLVGAIFAIFALILYGDEVIVEEKKRVLGCLIPGAISTLMITNLFPWGFIQKWNVSRSLFEKFQFMWRFNILSLLFLSLAAAYGFYYFFVKGKVTAEKEEIKYKAMIMISFAACFSALIFLNQFVKQAEQYGNDQTMEKGYMDRLYVVPGFPYDRDGEIDSNLASVEFSDIKRESKKISFNYAYKSLELTDEERAYIEVPLTYYPGYKAYIDGNKVETECSIWGVVRIYLPENETEGHLQVVYEDDILVKTANIVSLITILACCFMPLVMKRKRIRNEREKV